MRCFLWTPAVLLTLIVAGTSAVGDADPFLSNWMGKLNPVIGNRTLLDLTLPGTHDTQTYDLGLTISPGAVDGHPILSYIMHVFSGLLPDKWIRELAFTQSLNITAQLDNGVRFLDFRTMMNGTTGDWYSLHFMETKQKSLVYLAEVRDWLTAHPQEIAVFKVSKHGSECNVGAKSYAGVSAADKQAYWAEIKNLFGSMLFDTRTSSLNTTTINELVQLNQRVVLLMEDWEEFTNSDPLALDACSTFYHPSDSMRSPLSYSENDGIDGEDSPAFVTSNSSTFFGGRYALQMRAFQHAKTDRATAKALNKFYALWMPGSVPKAQRLDSFLVHYLPWLDKNKNVAKCAASFEIPGLTDWCPMGLLDCVQLTMYYNQFSLEEAIQSGFDLPMAIATGALDQHGTIRTGAWPLINSTAYDVPISPSDPNAFKRYSYVHTLIYSAVRRLCSEVPNSQCSSVLTFLEQQRALNPKSTWNSPSTGRLLNVP